MLSTLRIKNLALVADLTLEFQPGYNAITGETGAGKSILIGGLGLVLGERADRALIRSGSDSCSVEAVFHLDRLIPSISSFLDENGLEPCEERRLVLKRVFTSAGSNRQFVNGSPTTLGVLAALGEWLVDFHGPHDHQSLLQPARQLDILDAYGNLSEARAAFAALAAQRAELVSQKAALIVDEKTYAQQLDLLRFQSREISEARLRPEEDTELDLEYKRAGNAARLLELGQSALAVLGEAEDSIVTRLGSLGRLLRDLQRLDPAAGPLAEAQEQSAAALRDLQNDLSHYLDRVDLDPVRLRELEERLNLIHALKRKYGATLADVIAFGEEAARKLASLERREAELARINLRLRDIDGEILRAGQALSASRRRVIPKLARAVVAELGALGFKQSRFEVALHTTPEPPEPPRPSGLDTIEFQFAPNPGEPPRPLRAIASSGEMARVMLALKTVLAAEDNIPVLVFDEVDANVGGETAYAVGMKMRQIARRRQVLCVTHLAPVAAHSDVHYVVNKQVRDGRTLSEIELLDEAGRVGELARMLGGGGEAARRHAQALLKERSRASV